MFMWLIDFQVCTKRQARLPMKSDPVFAAPNKQVQKNVEKKNGVSVSFRKKLTEFDASFRITVRVRWDI